LHKPHNHITKEVCHRKRTTSNPPDECGCERLVCDEETETAVCDAAEDDDAAEPEMNVSEPTTVCGTVFDETGVVVGSESGLDDCCSDYADAEEFVYD